MNPNLPRMTNGVAPSATPTLDAYLQELSRGYAVALEVGLGEEAAESILMEAIELVDPSLLSPGTLRSALISTIVRAQLLKGLNLGEPRDGD